MVELIRTSKYFALVEFPLSEDLVYMNEETIWESDRARQSKVASFIAITLVGGLVVVSK